VIEPQPSHGQRSFPLEPSDLERQDFLAFVSHELRSPLNAIKGWAHLLRKAGPLAPAQAHALEAIERSVATQARLIESLLDGGHRHPDAAAQRQHQAERADVLIVEDDDDTRHMIEHLLREQGFEPAAFSRTADAYAYLEQMPAQSQPRLIVSDIGMPEEDGYSFIRRVHALHAQRHEPAPPAVAVTAFTSDTARRRALDAGFEAHLGKPVDPAELQVTVERLLQRGRGQPVP
jgi:CheY-like chemotaxis protein